jgi:hypothetical protein
VHFFKEFGLIDYSLLIGIHHGRVRGGDLPQVWRGQGAMFCMGIIDILTEYNGKKVLEKGFKQLLWGRTVSCTDPEQYGDRFLQFVREKVIALWE